MATLGLTGTLSLSTHGRLCTPCARDVRSRPRVPPRASSVRDGETGRVHQPGRRISKAEALPTCSQHLSTVRYDGLELQRVRVEELVRQLQSAPTYREKLGIVHAQPETHKFLRGTREGMTVSRHLALLAVREAYLLLLLLPLGQSHVLSTIPTDLVLNDAFDALVASLDGVERAFDAIGGVAGYQLQCLCLISGGSPGAKPCGAGGEEAPTLHVPRGLRLNGAEPEVRAATAAAVAAGLAAVPAVAEVWPLGGCGDRLGLACEETGEALPAAVLKYAGSTLLETLARDTGAREYLHWRVHGGPPRPTTPVAIMTSAAKGNHWRVEALCEASGWWGRGRALFKPFRQPLVPVVAAADARWLLPAPLTLLMKPGGHGVIWKLMLDHGVYSWLAAHGRRAAVVRQISNPMAGVDNTMLALMGRGQAGAKAFGFASCERVVGAAEGINVLARYPGGADGPPRYAVTNVEYTDFARRGMQEEACGSGSGHSAYPANANILYVDLKRARAISGVHVLHVQAAEAAVRGSIADGDTAAVLPGLLLNAGKRVTVRDASAGGATTTLNAGRLECTMQNLADCFAAGLTGGHPTRPPPGQALDDGLPTFLVTNTRRKVTSSAKRAAAPGSTAIHQTPLGSFYDLQLNGADLLARCGFRVPQVGAVAQYLAHGPGMIFLHHPALGPLWSVVAQKLRGGRLAPRAELQLEVAEADVQSLDVEGSLLVLADDVLGHMVSPETRGPGPPAPRTAPAPGPASPAPAPAMTSQPCEEDVLLGPGAGGGGEGESRHPLLTFSDRGGRVRLWDVAVRNAGVDYSDPGNVYWRHAVARAATCRVILRGRSEFEARGVRLEGPLEFVVPDGHRLRLMADACSPAGWRAELEALEGPEPSWRWRYGLGPQGDVLLAMEEPGQP